MIYLYLFMVQAVVVAQLAEWSIPFQMTQVRIQSSVTSTERVFAHNC